ncbi:hypothetical protein SNEBB_009086 [Seison nebaliae]|nr:hypothetical protein SNEBB_009086 [Seison nebaliae]
MADTKMKNKDDKSSRSYLLRPQYDKKFKSKDVEDILDEVLSNYLRPKQYSPDEVGKWCDELNQEIQKRMTEADMPRYKFITQCCIAERRGAGVNMNARCFWDNDTDNYAHAVYMSDTLICAAVVFGVFYY